MAITRRDRFFASIAELGVRRPWTVLTVMLLLLLGFGAAIPGLGVSTSRTGLVSDDDPQQARMNAFYQRFGRPDVPLFVVSGGTVDDRRAFVDRLEASLEAEPEFAGKVLARLRPQDLAEVLLLQDPGMLADLQTSLPPDLDVPQLIAEGLPAWIGAIDAQLEAGLEGEVQATASTMSDLGPQLERLTQMADALDGALSGRLSLGSEMARPGVDDAGYLVTANGDHNLITIFATLTSDEGVELKPMIERLRALRDEARADASPEVTADLTGIPALSVDELDLLELGLRRSSIATTAGIFLLCWILFRSLRQTLVALVPLLPGVVLTLAFVRFVFADLNLVTSSFVAVLLGLGIDFSVHLVARRNEESRRGANDREAVIESLRRTGPGVLTGAAITAVAFLTTTTTDFTAYAELGIITAVGLAVIVFASFFLIPPLLVIGRSQSSSSVSPELPGLRTCVVWVRRLRGWLIGGAAIGAVAGGLALNHIGFDTRYFNFLPEATESARGLIRLEYDPVASPVFAAIPAETIEDARRISDALRAFDSVAGVQSPSDLVPALNDADLEALRRGLSTWSTTPDFRALEAKPVDREALRVAVQGVVDRLQEVAFALRQVGGPVASAERTQAAFARVAEHLASLDPAGQARLASFHQSLGRMGAAAWHTALAVTERGRVVPSDLPPRFAQRFLARDGQAVAVYAVPAGQFWDREVAAGFATDVRSVDPGAVGLAMIHVAHGEMILRGFERASLISVGLIVILLWLDFRRLSDALLALLPTALGWLWMLGCLALLGVRFDVANIVALPLVLGIGIAFGVHMMHRVREKPEAGRERVDLDVVVRGTGGAIVVAAVTTMAGFAGLMLGKYGAMLSLGIVMVVGIAASLLATLFVLPAVLLWLRQAE